MKELCFLALIMLTINSCIYQNINSFDKYCNHISGDDNWALTTNFDKEAIKADFVDWYNYILLSDIGRNQLDGASAEDSVVQYLYKHNLIGVTQNEDTLFIRNDFLISESDSILQIFNVPKLHTFNGFTDKFEYYLKNQYDLRNEMIESQSCMYRLMGTLYERIVIIGSEADRYVIINEKH